jgi:hypothetical protein
MGIGGKNSGYITGPLQMAAGAGLSLIPGGAALGVPLMTSGLGTTVGQAAGGSSGASMGAGIGGALGGIGEGFGGMGPLGSSLGGTQLGQSFQGTVVGSALKGLMGGWGGGTPAAGAPGSSVAAGVTPTPTGAPGAFPAPGSPPTPQAQAEQLTHALANQFSQGQGGGQIAPSTPVAAGAAQPAVAAAGTPVSQQGLSGYLKSMNDAGLTQPALSMASQLFGGGQGQQAPRAPLNPAPRRQATGGASPVVGQEWLSPAVSSVPTSNAAATMGPNYSPINPPNFSPVNPSALTPQQMQLAMLLQGGR